MNGIETGNVSPDRQLIFPHMVRVRLFHEGQDVSEETIMLAGTLLEAKVGIIRVRPANQPASEGNREEAKKIVDVIGNLVGDKLREAQKLTFQQLGKESVSESFIRRIETLMNEIATGLQS